jgi:hypothetical protein
MPSEDAPSKELVVAIKKEANQQAARYLVAGIIGIVAVAATGWWLLLKPLISKAIGGVPSGAVVAFDLSPDEPCPDGWTTWREATSRVIIGAGNGDLSYEAKFKKDENGVELTSRAYREHGGAERETLIEDQLPPHTHEFTGFPITTGGNDGLGNVLAVGDRTVYGKYTPDGTISVVGKGNSINNMPPYVALYYCKKR